MAQSYAETQSATVEECHEKEYYEDSRQVYTHSGIVNVKLLRFLMRLSSVTDPISRSGSRSTSA